MKYKMVIREGRKEDMPQVLKLIKELAKYENSLEEVSITVNDLENDGFGKHPFYWFLVAEKNSRFFN